MFFSIPISRNPALGVNNCDVEHITHRKPMTQVVIENPIINSPFDEPKRHFKFAKDDITNEVLNSRRVSSYFIPIAQPKMKKGAEKQTSFDTDWMKDRIEENL